MRREVSWKYSGCKFHVSNQNIPHNTGCETPCLRQCNIILIKSFQIVNYHGAAAVVVSCVTKDGPAYKPHPHNLVGREGCKRGICTMTVNSSDMICTFTSLGIQCVKKKDIDESLRQRESLKVDPFKSNSLKNNSP